jgi:glycosyltransferase involved in cell wall biosynthesis
MHVNDNSGGATGRPRISVAIPAYNEELMIGPCLRTVLAQSRAADEVIVVDNNSSDRTANVLLEFAADVIVPHEARQGFSTPGIAV